MARVRGAGVDDGCAKQCLLPSRFEAARRFLSAKAFSGHKSTTVGAKVVNPWLVGFVSTRRVQRHANQALARIISGLLGRLLGRGLWSVVIFFITNVPTVKRIYIYIYTHCVCAFCSGIVFVRRTSGPANSTNGSFPAPWHDSQGFFIPVVCCNRCVYCFFCALCKQRGVNHTFAARLEYPGHVRFICFATSSTKAGHEVHSEHET